MRLLNVGCGGVLHPDWVNLDSSAVLPGVVKHDLRRGLPFPDGAFDAIFGSHVLEHLDPEAAERLLREVHRVLRPGGIARIVVPDLESIANLYLDALTKAEKGDSDAEFRYDWAMLELYDQAVRTVSGGRMARLLKRELDERKVRFIESRVGREAMRLALGASPVNPFSRGVLLRRMGSAVFALRASVASAFAWLLLGRDGAAALREGLFRRSGEVHQYMYDRFSLKRAMEEAGFTEVRNLPAGESAIPDFARYELEVQDGQPRKPDSIYLEGRRDFVASDEPERS